MYIVFCVIGIFSFSALAQTLNDTDIVEPPSVEEQIFEQLGSLTLLGLAPLTREELIERLEQDLNIHVKSGDTDLFDRYLLSYIYNYFQTMKFSDTAIHVRNPYHLYSLGEYSQRLVSIRNGNEIYFATNAGDNMITNRFKEIMDVIYSETSSPLPDEIEMTFEYNNELYAQLNELVLSSDEIKDFIRRHSGVVFDEDSEGVKSFTRNELLMILKQYLELPVHIRDNLALAQIVRVDDISSNIFFTILGIYNPSDRTITLSDAAFEKEGTDDQGEGTFLHEIGHALWGKSIWEGLSQEAKKEYEKLSWHGGERINDEFISNNSIKNVKEDFSEHFSAYINNGDNFRHIAESKYNWLKEHIFLNVEYLLDVADNLKIFVESEHGDTTAPYFTGLPYESFKITISVDDVQAEDLVNGVADVRVEVSGLFDDLSGVKEVNILMRSVNDYFWIKSPEDFEFCDKGIIDPVPKNIDGQIPTVMTNEIPKYCVFIDPNKPGWYAYYSSEKLALNYAEDYWIDQVELEDKAGNSKVLRSNLGEATAPFPGTRGQLEEEEFKREQREKELEQIAQRRQAATAEERRKRKAATEEVRRRRQAAREATGYNVLNLSDLPVGVYQNDEEVMTLSFGECINLSKQEVSSLGLKTVTELFDWKFDTLICSNIDDSTDVSACRIYTTSLIKKNAEEKYILDHYFYERSADFSRCKPLQTQKEEVDERKIEREEKEEKTAQEEDDQEENEEEVNREEDDQRKKTMEEENLKRKQARSEKSAEEAEGFNVLNLSEFPVRVYQDDDELMTLNFGECIGMVEQDLSLLSLEKITDWIDWQLDALICSNVDDSSDVSACRVNATSLIKQSEDGGHTLADYKDEAEADFGRCRPSPAKEEEREAELQKVAEEAIGFNIFNLSDLPVRIYQHQERVLELEPKKCVSITAQELLALTLQKMDSSSNSGNFICTNIENSLNLYECDVTSTSLVKQNEEGDYVLADYQKEKLVDFSQCSPLTAEGGPVLETDTDLSDSVSRQEKETDNAPPYFINPSSESVSVSVEDLDESRIIVKVELNGLFDDLSEIKRASIYMDQRGFQSFWIHSTDYMCNATPENVRSYYDRCIFSEPDKLGQYFYYKTLWRDKLYSGDYRISQVSLEDTSGNKTQTSGFNSTVFLQGRRLWLSRSNRARIKQDLEIRTSKTADGDTVVHIQTTDMTHFNLYNMYVRVVDTDTGEDLRYLIDTRQLASLNNHFNSPIVSGKMSLPIVIPKELASARYRVDWIAFQRKRGDNRGIRVDFSRRESAYYFDHISSEEDQSIAQPVVDDIAMEVLEGKNTAGGDTSIKVDVPISGLDRGEKGSVEVILRTPTGDQISFQTRLRPSSYNSDTNVRAVLHLGAHHAEGEYMVTHISTSEDFTNTVENRINHSGLELYKGGKRVHEARLLERKIKTTLEVLPPKPQLEKH